MCGSCLRSMKGRRTLRPGLLGFGSATRGAEYTHTSGRPRGNTANTDLLIAGTDGPTPTFDVPEELDRATTYEYLLDGAVRRMRKMRRQR